MNNDSNPNHSPSARANSVVRAYLAGGGELSQGAIAVLVDQNPDLADELRQAVEVAQLTRQAQQRAAQAPSEHSSDSNNSSLSGLLLDEAGWELAGYTIGERIGGGKFGEVFEALSTETGQMVAIKCLRREYREHPQALERFRMEAEALSRLDHPGIVRVLDVRTADTVPCIVMERVTGRDLHRSTRSSPLDPSRAASIIAEAADACHAAHERGILHRDIKPENILLDESGHPRLTDFGLAKLLDRDVELTGEEQALGTPHYMPPEQYDRRLGPTTHHADVYALGGTLYYLLTGRPPFPIGDGVGRETTLHQIGWARPRSPVDANDQVPADLALICLMCLEKRPHDRYAAAQALADDLRRFLGGRPIRARLPGPAGRSWRWCTRRPFMAAMLGVLLLTLTGGSFAAFHFAQEANTQRKLTEEARTAEADVTSRRVILSATMAIDARDWERAERMLASVPEHLRNWEWRYLTARCDTSVATCIGHEDRVTSAVFSADGSRLVTTSDDKTARVWEPISGRALLTLRGHEDAVYVARFSTDRSRIVTGSGDNTARVWDTDSGVEIFVLRGHEGPVVAASFSPDGSRVVTGSDDHSARVWDARTGAVASVLRGHGERVDAVAFDPEGKRVLTMSQSTARLWMSQTGQEVAVLLGLAGEPRFDPLGAHVIALAEDGTAGVWDASTGKQVLVLRDDEGGIADAVFRSDAKTAVTISNHGRARVWRLADGSIVSETESYHRALHTVKLSGDGTVAAGHDQHSRTFIVVDVLSGQASVIDGAPTGMPWIALRPDGSLLAARSEHYWRTRVWDTSRWASQVRVLTNEGWINAATFSPDGSRVLVMSNGTARVLDSNTGAMLAHIQADAPPSRYSAAVYGVFSDDGTRVITQFYPDPPQIWKIDNGEAVEVTPSGKSDLYRQMVMQEAAWALIRRKDESCEVWDAIRGERIATLSGQLRNVNRAVRSRDGALVLAMSYKEGAELWALPAGRQLAAIGDESTRIYYNATFSYDNSRFAAVHLSRGISVWDVATGAEVSRFECGGHVIGVAFDPSGKYIATHAEGAWSELWDIDTGERVAVLRGMDAGVSAAEFSPDGSRIITHSEQSIVMADVLTGQEVLELRGAAEIRPFGATYSSDGSRVLMYGYNGVVVFDSVRWRDRYNELIGR